MKLRIWIPIAIVAGVIAMIAIVIIIRQPGQNTPSESSAEQAEHAQERNNVMKDFYNPPKPTTRVTDPFVFDKAGTQPATNHK